jgi:hypothetical protein
MAACSPEHFDLTPLALAAVQSAAAWSVKRSVIRVTVMTSKIYVLIVAAMITSALRADTTIPLPSPAPDSGAAKKISPNQVLADIAREAILKSLKPEYDKQDNWGIKRKSSMATTGSRIPMAGIWRSRPRRSTKVYGVAIECASTIRGTI